MGKLKLESVGENEWFFVWPRITDEANDIFFNGLDCLDEGKTTKAKQLFEKALALFPEHIDALHHLSITAGNKKEEIELNEKAVNIGLNAFPKKFNETSRLEWGWTENRPFLRAYNSKGLIALDGGKTEEAIKIFNQIISWNPNDNQGVRMLLADIYTNNRMWDKMIELSKKYPNDYDPNMNFGFSLTLFKLGKKEEATKELKKSIKKFPLCGKILLEKNPKKPKSNMPGYITVGGKDQAYEFWEGQGKSWREQEVKEWLESAMTE
ncbi:MAG: transcriptional repressor TCF25 family protein [Nanoarchaeota archaeon]|nr:transcriptional repressor TCF25 family protein [Nanoarchaeota archaeon]MBU0977351.1 transcriptional repressor TCF25 family protein [Nanoarchaeota archaeon]